MAKHLDDTEIEMFEVLQANYYKTAADLLKVCKEITKVEIDDPLPGKAAGKFANRMRRGGMSTN